MTAHELLQDGIRYVPSKVAAKGADLSADYISRMCREGRVHGVWHRGAWYVHEPSLARFLEEKRRRQDELNRVQAEQLKKEFEAAQRANVPEPLPPTPHALTAKPSHRSRTIALATLTLLIATSAAAAAIGPEKLAQLPFDARSALIKLSWQLPSIAELTALRPQLPRNQLAAAATSLDAMRDAARALATSITGTIGNFLFPVQYP